DHALDTDNLEWLNHGLVPCMWNWDLQADSRSVCPKAVEISKAMAERKVGIGGKGFYLEFVDDVLTSNPYKNSC
ncbi:MAG: hypothetical protein K8F91_17985, partial [Candidatus Obscuribacterales bacterium]|nr:hypothetical protein [Candidatus Obscuribacterales bacterium]